LCFVYAPTVTRKLSVSVRFSCGDFYIKLKLTAWKFLLKKKYFWIYSQYFSCCWMDFYHQTKWRKGYHNGQHIRLDRNFFVALSIVLLIVYFIIRSQLQLIKFHKNYCTKTNSYYSLSLTIPLAPSSLKKLNGELINKQFGDLFKISNEEILGKTDHDFLSEK
jgi:hypothetical protein